MFHASAPSCRRSVLVLGLAGFFGLSSAPLQAEAADLVGPETLSALVDVRLVDADGERAWTDGGFGKTRYGGEVAQPVEPLLAEAALIWQPRFRWDVAGTVVVAHQNRQEHEVDLIEAFVAYKPVPTSETRFSGRAGLFWPPVSLEHEGAAWSVSDMITPSAINSWIGEEVKVLGAEATVTRELGSHRLSGTLAIFGFNDTAGTLLSFRGWALHDLKATAFGHQPLPRLSEDWALWQAHATRPLIELDSRPGFYGKLSWTMAAPVLLELFHYDNRGDPTAYNAANQWGWRTRFTTLSGRVDLTPRTRILAQALAGTTAMGWEEPVHWPVETRYRSAYVRATHEAGPLALSGRLDWFDTRERGSYMDPAESEEGWAATAAARLDLSGSASLLLEALHVDSERGVRRRDGLDPQQDQTLVQAAVRLTL